MLPAAELVDTGMRCIYGRTLLDERMMETLPEIFNTGFVPFVGMEGRTLAMGIFRSQMAVEEAAARFAPAVKLTAVPDYLMWICVAPLEGFAMSDEDLRVASHETLWRKALELTEGWHQALRDVIEGADVPSLFQVAIRSAQGVPEWASTRVTFLGDAIHAMTPAGGIGANTALRDAEVLARVLGAANRGECGPMDAIGAYEAEMRVYGTAAVKQSMEAAGMLYRVPFVAMEETR
jgi:2-polyprenyl-6-methoxyphenol hydroxylase-like FAD-dependent oxidoreductase